MDLDKIYNEDCFVTMERMKQAQWKEVNIVLTSPPYNTGRDMKSERARLNHEGRYDEYSENLTTEEYDNFTVRLFNSYDSILAQNGVVLYNISYGTENPTQMWTCIAEVCRKTNFTIADTIVWKKGNALPNNVSPNKLTRICEFVFVLCRKTEYNTFQMNKEEAHGEGYKQAIYKNVFNLIEAPNNDGSNPLNKATFSTVFVRKLLSMYAKKNDIVYDSFMGTGTTAIGCIQEGLSFIGSELSAKQCEYANKRIALERSQLKLF